MRKKICSKKFFRVHFFKYILSIFGVLLGGATAALGESPADIVIQEVLQEGARYKFPDIRVGESSIKLSRFFDIRTFDAGI